MEVYFDGIKPQENHTYFHEKVGNVMSVTTILNNGKNSNFSTEATNNGNAIHETIELLLKNKKNKATELYNSLTAECQSKVRSLVEDIKLLKISNASVELAFVAKDKNISFGGTVDLLTNTLAIDFKTGGFNNKYPIQVSAYAVSNKKEQALILWFKDNTLQKTMLNKKEIEDYYNQFYNQAKNIAGIKSEFDISIANELAEYSSINQAIKDLQTELENKKAIIANKITSQGFNTYRLDNFTCYTRKGVERVSLTEDAKNNLLLSDPYYFKKTISKPSFTIREC